MPSPWLKSLFQNRSARRANKKQSQGTRKNLGRFKPGLESLEARYLLSTFGVQVFDDGAPVSGTTIQTGPNSIAFIGSSADFSSHLVLGTTNSPGTPGGATLQLGPQSQVNATTTGTHTLTVELTSTDYSLPSGSPIVVSSSAGGEYVGGGSVTSTYQTFFDPNDQAYGMPAGSVTPLETATASGTNALVFSPGTATGSFARPNPLFSLTSVATFTINASGGDLVNLGATSTASAAPVATTTLTTTPTPTNVTLGTSSSPVILTDTADLEGGNSPTGTITFTLYNPSGTLVDTETATVNGNGTYTTPTGYTLPTTGPVTGTYQWDASYGGDSYNTPASDSSAANEQVTISPATPVINTQQQPATATVGSSIADKATVTGLVNASGTDTVTFNLYSSATTQNSTTLLYTDTETVSLSGSTATATSKGYTATNTGTDYWVATFNGDTNNNSVTSTATAEPVSITPNTPAINTQQQPASAVVGSSIADKATVTGLVNASGTDTVTFNLYSSATTQNSTTLLFSDTETVSLSGSTATATSKGYTATNTGTDYWVATFNGDSNNNSVTSTATAEPVSITPATPAITTSPYVITTTGVGGQYATIGFWHNKNGQAVITSFDTGSSSTLLGNSLASSYKNLFGYANPYTSATLGAAPGAAPGLAGQTNAQVAADYLGLWTPSGLQKNTYVQAFAVALGSYASSGAGSFNVGSNGAAFGVSNNTTLSVGQILTSLSSNFNPTTGLFYNGDSTLTSAANNVLDAINSSGENPNGTTVVSVVKLNDSATLSGGYNDGGTLTFYLMGPGSTASTPLSSAVYTDTVTVNGNGTYTTTAGNNPGGYLPAATGTYQWVAVYSGDTNNSTITSPFGSEPWTVGQASPTVTTVPGGSVVLGSGSKLTDTATLADASNPGGTITFYLLAPGATSSTPLTSAVYTDTVTVTGNGTYTTATGTNPGGYLPTQAGTYEWVAVYSGDANNAAATSSFGDEPETVSTASPSLTTTPGGNVAPGSITISGNKLLDLSGDGFSSDDTPLGSVTINLYQESNSSSGLQTGTGGDKLVATTKTASDGTYSFTGLAAGTYYVQEAVPTGYIQTGGGPNGTAGNTYYTVVATGGHTYSGYNFDDYQVPTCLPTCISFKVTAPNGSCQTVTDLAGHTQQGDTVTVTFTVPAGMSDTLTLVSYIAPSSSFSDSNAYQQQIYQERTGTFAPGTYSLSVKIPNSYYQIDFICGPAIGQLEPNQNGNAYGPDSANILYHSENRFLSGDNGGTTAPSASSLNSTPPVTVTPTVSGSGAQALTDSATLSGAVTPTGTITFYLMAPGATASTPLTSAVYSDTVTVNGNGTYTTSMGTNPGGYVALTTGTYQWVAVYSGDSKNSSVTSPFGSEPETVQAAPSIVTTPGGSVSIGCGTKLTDSATLSGGISPTGTITFYLFAPGVTPNATNSNAIYTDKVTINGNGTYTTAVGSNPGGYLPTLSGTYQWVAVYSGDGTNSSVTSPFGSEPETVGSATPVSAGGFATIGFWHNKNGQAVINSFDNGPSDTQLGNWLATNFPSLFGTANPYTGTSLAGLTNAQVAQVYANLWTPSGVTKNTYVQAFAVALGMYADDPALGYDSTAAKYGFKSVSGGGSNATFNVGSNGAAFGVANNTSLSVFQILTILNNNFSSSTGLFYGGDQTTTSAANNVVNGINTAGDISLISGSDVGATSTTANVALLSSLANLGAGSLYVSFTDTTAGDDVVTEKARIDDAINSLNSQLGSLGVSLVDIGSDTADADITIQVASNSDIGGVAQGVLGVTEIGGQITLLSGWNWYLGSDASAIGSNQYDFQTIATHELGHALGLGHSQDTSSVMYPYLQTGATRRDLTANDIAVIDSAPETGPEPLMAALPATTPSSAASQATSETTQPVVAVTSGRVNALSTPVGVEMQVRQLFSGNDVVVQTTDTLAYSTTVGFSAAPQNGLGLQALTGVSGSTPFTGQVTHRFHASLSNGSRDLLNLLGSGTESPSLSDPAQEESRELSRTTDVRKPQEASEAVSFPSIEKATESTLVPQTFGDEQQTVIDELFVNDWQFGAIDLGDNDSADSSRVGTMGKLALALLGFTGVGFARELRRDGDRDESRRVRKWLV